MVALHLIAEMNRSICERATEMILKNSYVDDLIQSVPRYEDAHSLAEEVQGMLQKGGFNVKHWIISGDDSGSAAKSDVTLLNVDEEKVLGMRWLPKQDHFMFQVKINFSQRQKRVPTGPDVTKTNIDAVFPMVLTRRMVLGQAARIYDPLGFIAPVTITSKILHTQNIDIQKGQCTRNFDIICMG